jgi:hypothetical protein
MAVDAYGFPLPATLTQLNIAERSACEDASLQTLAAWKAYADLDRLPETESRRKEVLRKVSAQRNTKNMLWMDSVCAPLPAHAFVWSVDAGWADGPTCPARHPA